MQPPGAHARKTIPIAPGAGAPAAKAVAAGDPIALYEAHKKIYPRAINGVFARWRLASVLVTQLVFYGLPWLDWGQRQMVLFDLEARRFYIFGLVLYPQDFIYLTGLLIVCALSLFLFTAVAGRLWCGFACPQTVYTEIFVWIEQRIEGERSARLRLDRGRWTAEKLRKKLSKHALWLALALWTGLTFVGYFVPLRQLGAELLSGQGGWQIFWVLFYSLATWGNAGFMREQVCKYMCPYARFQSAMFDRDTLIVGYDGARGEPRGARSKTAARNAGNLGDCIDCTLCVQVCPVGIDIRRGLQYECIGCGLCVDACNAVMDKMQYPRALIRYATQNAATGAQMLRRVLRPRVLGYGALLLALCAALLASLVLRTPFKVDVLRDRAALARSAPGGKLENVYRLQIMNATEAAQRYRIAASGLPGLELASDAETDIAAAQSRWVAARLQIPYGTAQPGAHTVYFQVQALAGGAQRTEKSVFLVPR